MDGVIDRLEQLQADFAAAVVDALPQIADLPDAEVMRMLNASGRVLRSNDALQVAATVQVRERSEGLRGERMTTSYGGDRPADLLQMVLRADARSAARLVKAAGLTAQMRGITDGELLPSRYDELRKALAETTIGLDGFLAATAPDAPAPTPAELAQFAQVLAAYLDPDGAEPTDDAASRARGLWIGRLRDGRVPLRGELLPEVAAQLARLTDSLLNPRIEGAPVPQGVHFVASESDPDDGLDPIDPRTRVQKMHDAFATILGAAARGGELPDLGGAAPTLMITVDAADYAQGSGWAHVEGGDGGDVVRDTSRHRARSGWRHAYR